MFIDTHCHLQDDKYNRQEMDSIIKRAKENDVNFLIVSGYDEESNNYAIELSEKYEEVYATIGYHPLELDHINDSDLNILEQLVNHPKVVAVGEIGLDYYYDKSNSETQKEMFIKLIEFANKHNKPIVIHSRDSIEDTYEIIKKYKHENIKGVLHCYASSYEMALKFLNLGIIFGVGGVVTYKNSNSLKDFVSRISLEDIILETDAPYLSPEPKRGTINEPENIPYIAAKIAELKNVSVTEVADITTKTARALFDF